MRLVLAICALAVAITAAATPPPPIPSGIPATPPATMAPATPGPRIAPHFRSLDQLRHMEFSNGVYYVFLRELQQHLNGLSNIGEENAQARQRGTRHDILRSHAAHPPLLATTNTFGSTIYNVNASTDANQDVEPAVSVLTYSGNDWIVTADTKTFSDLSYSTLSVRTFVSRATGAVPPFFDAPVQLPTPAGYQNASDPYLATNPYSSSGVSPHTFYCVSVLHGASDNQANAIAIWRSTDAGVSWQGPTLIANSEPNHFYDKPSIAVSYYGGTLGWLYVVWNDVDDSNVPASYVNNVVKVARSCDGGATFTAGQTAAGPAHIDFPSIVVDNTSGHMYVTYVDQTQSQIEMSTLWDGPSCSNNVPSLMATENVTGWRKIVSADAYYTLKGNVRASTNPVARFNFAARTIGVAWHEWEPSGTATDAYLASRNMSTGTWTTPTGIASNSVEDQFMPSLDSNGAGSWLVTFYNRAGDPNNLLYEAYYRPFSADGVTPLQVEANYGGEYNPDSQPTNPGFIGDYQDVWEWDFLDGSQRWNSAWIATSESDNWVSEIYNQ